MAYDPNIDPNKQNQLNQPTNQPPTTSSAPGAGPAPAGGKSAAPTPQATPQQPFQNLSAYLNANQPQIQQQASKTAGDLTNQYGQVTGAIDKAKSDFGNQITSGYAAPNADVVSQATSNPTQFASNPDNVKAFQSLYNDQYTGPSNFESSGAYGDLSGQVNKAVSNANQVNTVPGLENYYQSQNPNATQGGNILDALLLQGSPEAYGQVQAAAKPFSSLQDYLTGATTGIDTDITNAQNLATQTSQGLQNQFTGEGGIIPQFQTDLSNRLTQTKANAVTNADKAIQDYQLGQATPDELKILGIDTSNLSDKALAKAWESAQNLRNDYGVNTDWSTLFTKQNPDVIYQSPGSVATPEEIQKAQALGTLTGQDLSSYLGTTSPNGQLVTPSRTGLQDLGQNLGQRDSDLIVQNASAITPFSNWNGGPAPSFDAFHEVTKDWANKVDNDPNSPSYGKSNGQGMVMAAQKIGNQALVNALIRAGYNNPVYLPPPTSVKGPGGGSIPLPPPPPLPPDLGVIHAS